MRIEALNLVCRDLDAQRNFYSEVLGLPLLENSETQFAVQVGQTRLSFRHQPETVGVYHFAFNIPENQLAEAKRWIAERAALIDEDGNDEFTASGDWNAQMFYFRDADGNILECIARHRLANASAQAFGPDSLLSISEIGHPVDNVPQSLERLQKQFDLYGLRLDRVQRLCAEHDLIRPTGVGAKRVPDVECRNRRCPDSCTKQTESVLQVFGTASDTFAPLGDDEGLIIVVKLGRPWFPTQEAAFALPFELKLEGNLHRFNSP